MCSNIFERRITSLVKVNSPVIGPSIAQTVFPATGDPFVINSDSGQEPVRTLLLEPPVPPRIGCNIVRGT